MVILRHVHGTWRKVGDFDEKATLLEWKASAVTAAAFAFFRLTDNNELMVSCEQDFNRFINNCKHCTILTNFYGKKCSSNFRRFFTHRPSLAAKLSELLASNWRGLVSVVKQFKRAEKVFDLRCRHGDITSRTPAEDRRFRWKGDFVGIKDVGCYSYSLRVLQTYGS